MQYILEFTFFSRVDVSLSSSIYYQKPHLSTYIWFGTSLILPKINAHLFHFRNIQIQVTFITPIHKVFSLLVVYRIFITTNFSNQFCIICKFYYRTWLISASTVMYCQVWGFAGTWWRIKHADHSHFSTHSWHLWQCEIFILMIFILFLPHLLKAQFVNIECMKGVGHTVKHDENQKCKGQQ